MMDAVYKYLPYWPVFVILMALSIFGAWFYLRITPSLYEATASVEIKDEQKGTYNTNLEQELDPLAAKKIIENEVQVLKSKTMLQEVVKNLHVYASYFEEGEMARKRLTRLPRSSCRPRIPMDCTRLKKSPIAIQTAIARL